MTPPKKFEFRPTLRGELVELIPLEPEHFETLFAVASDPKIWEQHPKWDRYKREVFEKFFAERIAWAGSLLVKDRATGAVIGSSSFKQREPDVVEIGWTFLARSHWGGRYNGEMKRLMLRHAFGHFPRVIFVIGPNNLRSRKAVEKIGGVFQEEGVSDDGTPRVIYRIDKANFESRDRQASTR
ncbi:MAG TPA: GNAT family N-acetyltransferase [Opitutaceae bacterium]|nr:GNAT family N-acetyltransferase [Opitutaceae bacterium]HND61564.1 GNAT family N-acetyltransferase [Opitutaceae bacterium]